MGSEKFILSPNVCLICITEAHCTVICSENSFLTWILTLRYYYRGVLSLKRYFSFIFCQSQCWYSSFHFAEPFNIPQKMNLFMHESYNYCDSVYVSALYRVGRRGVFSNIILSGCWLIITSGIWNKMKEIILDYHTISPIFWSFNSYMYYSKAISIEMVCVSLRG